MNTAQAENIILSQLATKYCSRGDNMIVPRAVTRDVYSELLETKVFPAIKARMPGTCRCNAPVLFPLARTDHAGVYDRSSSSHDLTEQDNASPHSSAERVIERASRGLDVRVLRQPPRSTC